MMMQSCLALRIAFDAMAAAGNIPADKNLSSDHWDVIKRCYNERAEDSMEEEGILNILASSQHFLEGQKFVTLSFVPEIIIVLKQALDKAYKDVCLPDVARSGIGCIRSDFYDRFYGIVIDEDQTTFDQTYMAEGVLLAAVVDPRTKTLEGLSHEHRERARAALDRRIKARQEEMRPAAATPDPSKFPSPEQTGSTTRKNSSSRNFLATDTVPEASTDTRRAGPAALCR